MMRDLCAALSRVACSAWVGAAVLFVVTSLKEVRSPQLDSGTKALLATLRFPSYYLFGFGLIGSALLLTLLAGRGQTAPLRSSRWAAGLLLLALLVMGIDYLVVYTPLAEMTAMAGEARPANFVNYHRWSMWLNTAHLGVSLVAALVLCWPRGHTDRETLQ